jgi:2-keto-3-deoxy-L-rhamnonate aldolase RhmA
VLATLQVLGTSVPCLVRAPSPAPEDLEVLAACGARGLIVPHVDTAEQALAAVQQVRGRGLVVVQAESKAALDQIGAIAAVSGVDAVFVGPYDLSSSLGVSEQFEHPVFLAAVEAIARTCRERRMPLGIFRMTPAELRGHEAQGFTLLAAGIDGLMLDAAAGSLLREFRG